MKPAAETSKTHLPYLSMTSNLVIGFYKDYFSIQYVGYITEIKTDSVAVNCLEKAANFFKYPAQLDEHFISLVTSLPSYMNQN
jgi:hypothetical protein